jgi:transposase-like protein
MCPRCKSTDIVKNGFKKLKDKSVQKYRCNKCNKYFTGKEKFHHLSEEQKNYIVKSEKSNYLLAKELNVYIRSIQNFKKNFLKK